MLEGVEASEASIQKAASIIEASDNAMKEYIQAKAEKEAKRAESQ